MTINKNTTNGRDTIPSQRWSLERYDETIERLYRAAGNAIDMARFREILREVARLLAERDKLAAHGPPKRRLKNKLARDDADDEQELEDANEQDEEHQGEHDGGRQHDDDDDELPELLTVHEAAELLGRAPKTIRNLGYRGQLRTVRRGRTVFFVTEDVLSYRGDRS